MLAVATACSLQSLISHRNRCRYHMHLLAISSTSIRVLLDVIFLNPRDNTLVQTSDELRSTAKLTDRAMVRSKDGYEGLSWRTSK